MSACPRSYGVSVSEVFSETRHQGKDLVIDPHTGKLMAKEQLMWLIKKGDLILSDEPKVVKQQFTKNFSATDQRKGQINLYAYDYDDLPERLWNAQNGNLMLLWSFSPYFLTSLRFGLSPYPRV